MQFSYHYRPKALSFIFAAFACVLLLGQDGSTNPNGDLPEFLERQFIKKTFIPKIRQKKAGLLTAEEWRQRIDETWGDSFLTKEDMLHDFDIVWEKINAEFACFQDLDVDWQGLRNTYRSEIEAGVSRGRFVAIMNHLALPLKEAHTSIYNFGVNFQTLLKPGTPLLNVGGWGRNDHFGAALTPLPDKTLLVYKAIENHPLGLVPGDIVLGYEGKPWHELYPQLIAAELPLTGLWWGSSPSAYEHSWLMAAGLNWHLFETIDIRKHQSGETLHLSTAPLEDLNTEILGTEQLPIPGVTMNRLGDIADNSPVSWGVIEGTNIGYIYIWAWSGDADVLFENAVRDLTLDQDTEGLIVDFRTNYGGNMFLSNPALSILFNKPVETVGFVTREDFDDHLSFQVAGNPANYVIPGTPDTFYNKPIAVLLGPGALSAGDQVALRMKFHPRARLFGKSTTTAFNGPSIVSLRQGWFFRFAIADAYLLSEPGHNLTHDELVVDEPVWLTPEDVAAGKDTVVEAALDWIHKENEPCESPRWIGHVTASGGGFTTNVHITNGANQEERVVLAPYDGQGNPLTQVEMFVPGNSASQTPSNELFGGEPVSHFSICAPDSVIVTAAYRIATNLGASAHIHESPTASTHFRIYPGQWDYVFDGMALLNLGQDSTGVRVRLLDYSGNEIMSASLEDALPPLAKQLTVFDSVFTDASNHIIEVETDQPASVLFLRGTRPGVTPGYLFQNNGLPDSAVPASGKRSASGAPLK